MAWNPFDQDDRVWIDLETSREKSPRTITTTDDGRVVGGDELGPPQASVAFQTWTAGDRLAYMDLVATATMAKREDDGSDTVRVGTLQAIHVALTARDSRGFPAVTVERENAEGDTVKVTEAFNVRDRAHLRLLPAAVFEELFDHASRIQPLPTANRRRKDDATPADPDAPVLLNTQADDPDAWADDEDPSPTPSTPGE